MVFSVNRFPCWYSINGQNDEFQTDVNCHKKFTACAATGVQSTEDKESQPVYKNLKLHPSHISEHTDIFRGNHAKRLTTY